MKTSVWKENIVCTDVNFTQKASNKLYIIPGRSSQDLLDTGVTAVRPLQTEDVFGFSDMLSPVTLV